MGADDAADLRSEQEDKVLTLFDACRHTGHELMLEIIASKAGPVGATSVPDPAPTISRSCRRICAMRPAC